MTTKELREKKGSLIHQMEDLKKRADLEKRMMTEDEGRQFDLYDNEMEAVNAEIRRAEKLESEVTPVEPESREANDKAYATAFEKMIRTGKRDDVLMKGFRTTQTGQTTTTTAGGYLVPTTMGDKIVKQLFTLSPLRQWATTYTTAGGGPMTFPTINDTANNAVILAEETQAAITPILTFGQKTLNSVMFHSHIIPVSLQLLQDSAFDVEQLVVEMLAARIASGENYYYVLGSGSGEPGGIAVQATTQGAYMAKTAMTRLTVLDLIHSVDAAYRMSPKCAFLMSDATLKLVKKLAVSSSDDRSLWQPNFAVGSPDTIEGFPYIIDNNVAAFGTAGNKPMFFGDFSQFYIRDVAGVQMQVFNERYAEFLQRGFQMFHRTDSELMNVTAIKHAVCAAT